MMTTEIHHAVLYINKPLYFWATPLSTISPLKYLNLPTNASEGNFTTQVSFFNHTSSSTPNTYETA